MSGTRIQTSPSPLPAEPFLRRLVRFSALAAGGVCLWLTVQNVSGKIDSVAGCGGAEGCSQILGGRWSAWMNIPVSTLALVFYAFVFLLTLRRVYTRHPGKTDFALTAAAAAALLAAGWFLGVLFFIEKTFCPYCAAIHALGFLWSLPVLWHAVRRRLHPARALLTGAAATVVLVTGQVLGPQPQTYLLTTAAAVPVPVAAPAVSPPAPQGVKTPRVLSYLNGSLTFRVGEMPLLGSGDAPHILVEYFDYTCASCRDMSKDLEQAKAAFPGKIAVIVLPCPLNRQCNPSLAPAIGDHPGACLLARLSLAVWRKAPAKFPEYHRFLMQIPLPADEAAARTRAAEHCGGMPALEQALADPWIDGTIQQAVQAYAGLSAKQAKMPKLLLPGGIIMHGTARDAASFTGLLRKHLAL